MIFHCFALFLMYSRYGDMRVTMGCEIFSMWQNLGKELKDIFSSRKNKKQILLLQLLNTVTSSRGVGIAHTVLTLRWMLLKCCVQFSVPHNKKGIKAL